MSDLTCRRLRIHGVVQGVGFRFALREEALRLGLRGWVRNRRDGTVEAVVAGQPDALDAIIAWSHRGPPAGRVEKVDVSIDEGHFATFEMRPTSP